MRLIRYRLIIPMLRSHHPPYHTARGAGVGFAWALTPLVGAQMFLVFMTWLMVRRLFNWDFNLIVGMAWTWTTNAVTLFPFYYLFYVTGHILMGKWNEMSGYQDFVDLWTVAFSESASTWEAIVTYTEVIIRDWGFALLVGSLPWVVVGYVVGYYVGLFFGSLRRKRKMKRAAQQQSAT